MNLRGRLTGKFLPEEWKFWRVLRKGLGLGSGGRVEKLESRSLGNSEGIRENKSCVSMETVIIIESSVPVWDVASNESQRKTTMCHESN